MIRSSLLALAALFLAGTYSNSAFAQTYEDGQGAIELGEGGATTPTPRPQRSTRSFQPQVGRKAAAKYMGQNGVADTPAASLPPTEAASGGSSGNHPHYLAIHVGGFVSDSAYKWGGKESSDNVGKYTLGVTYRVGEWVNSMDLAIRVDLNGYSLDEGRSTKISFLPIIMFPDSNSKFPLYFGAGVGAGVFVHQISKESPLSLDYQVLAGVRFFDIFENTGFFIEAGLKNHLNLLSDGQFNGTFVALGSVFTF